MKIILGLFLAFCCYGSVSAQLSLADDSLIQSATFYEAKDFSYYQLPGNSTKTMGSRKKNVVAKYNPVSLLLKGSMWAYQNVISPQLSSPCPYEISCSNFAKQSIQTFGVVKGVAIAADRLMRCNRISLMDVPSMDFNTNNHHIMDDPKRYKWH